MARSKKEEYKIDLTKKTAKVSKTELVEEIAKELNMSQKEVLTVINLMVEKIGKYLKKGCVVTIMDFGSFKVKKVQARKGRNISTGETIMIPAHNRVKFAPGKKLSESVDSKK